MHWLNPDDLAVFEGQLIRYLVNGHGDVDGFVLTPAREVHVPPHLGASLCKAAQVGSLVRVRGARPRGSEVVAAVSVTTDQGVVMRDDGPPREPAHKPHGPHGHKKPGPHGKPSTGTKAGKSLTIQGKVALPLHGPRGELRGALLDDGTALRLAPHHAEEHAALLRAGATLAVAGEVARSPYGTTLSVREIGTTPDTLQRLALKAHERPEKSHASAKHPKHT